MAIRDERWRLVVVYASGRREGEEAASHPLIGLDERTVCRIFGFKGSHVPSFPVEVHSDHLSELQPYAAKPVRLPAGTYAELVLDRDIANRRIFPAVDMLRSGTRKEELLLTETEKNRAFLIRHFLGDQAPEDAIAFLLKRMARTKNNEEFFARIAEGE